MFPIHLDLGFRVFHYYEGFYFLLAVLGAYAVAWRNLDRAGQDPEVLAWSLPLILLGAVAGARAFHFLFWDWGAFKANPAEFFAFWDGGLSITGGLAGGALAGLACFRHRKVEVWAYAARVSPAVLVGQAIGRVGCFLNGDAWGIPTRLPWGVREPRFGILVPGFRVDTRIPGSAWEWCVAKGFIPADAAATPPLHPTQLYECLGDLALAWLVGPAGPPGAAGRRPPGPGPGVAPGRLQPAPVRPGVPARGPGGGVPGRHDHPAAGPAAGRRGVRGAPAPAGAPFLGGHPALSRDTDPGGPFPSGPVQSVGGCFSQSTRFSPSIRLKYREFPVTRVSPCSRAVAAIMLSSASIGLPCLRRLASTRPQVLASSQVQGADFEGPEEDLRLAGLHGWVVGPVSTLVQLADRDGRDGTLMDFSRPHPGA